MIVSIKIMSIEEEFEFNFHKTPRLNEILSYHCAGKVTRYRVITVSGGVSGKGEVKPTGIRVEPLENTI